MELSDEKGTRPLKTFADLELGLKHLDNEVRKQSQLDAQFDTEIGLKLGIENDGDIDISKVELVLQILIGSGLVVLLPENSTNLCQLVHDYLAVDIRKSQAPEIEKLQKELEKPQSELRQTVRQLENSFKNSQAIADSLSLNSLINNNLVNLDELAKAMSTDEQWLPNIEAIASENRLQLASTVYRAIYRKKSHPSPY